MTKTKMNYKKTLTAVLCVLLSVVMGAGITFQTFGEANDVYYLADIKLFYEENDDDAKSDAKKRMDAQGYKMFGSDLHQGTGKKFVYMGYKTTKNEKEAITDIRLLGMDTDYQLYNYNQLLEARKKSRRELRLIWILRQGNLLTLMKPAARRRRTRMTHLTCLWLMRIICSATISLTEMQTRISL